MPVWFPGTLHFQMTASVMITITTTSDMSVSWNIA